MKKIKIIILLTFVLQLSYGQDLKWKSDISGWLSWMKPLYNGDLLVVTDGNVYCYNPMNGSVLWSNKQLIGIKKEFLEPIPFTNLMFTNSTNPTLVNTLNGQIVFKGSDHNLKRLDFNMYFEKTNQVLLLSQAGSIHNLVLVDIKERKPIWITPLGKKKSKINLVQSSMNETAVVNFDNDTKFTSDGNILFTSDEVLYNINLETGAINWKYESKEPAKISYITPDEENMILVSGDVGNKMTGDFVIEGINLKTGEQTWKEIKYKGVFEKIVFEEDKAIVFGGRAFQKIDYQSGKTLNKNYPPYGTLIDYVKTDKGYVIFKSTGTNGGSIFHIGFDGKIIGKMFKAGSQILEYIIADNAINLLTRSGSMKVDLTTGKKIKGSYFHYGNVSAYMFDKSTNAYYVCSSKDKSFYKLPLETFRPESLAPISFKGEALPNQIEIDDEGILMSDSKNFLKVDFNGEKLYYKYYGSWGIDVDEKINELMLQEPREIENDELNEQNNNVQNSFDKDTFSKYVDAVSKSRNAVVKYKIGEEGNKHEVISSVDKKTGETINSVHLQKDMPTFVIDPIYHVLYYKSGAHELSAYEL